MDYQKTADHEVAELKDLIGQLGKITNVRDNVRELETDDLIQEAINKTHKLVTSKGKVLDNYFFKNGVDHHDLYDVNHSELTKSRIHDMLTDTINEIKNA